MIKRISKFFVLISTFATGAINTAESTPLSDSPLQPIATCHLMGGIGNQLFQAAATLAYGWDNGATCYFPDLNLDKYDLIHNRDDLFFRLNASLPPRPCIDLFQESNWHSSEKIPFRSQIYLHGYFQSWKHFHHHRDKILSFFAPSDEISEYLNEKYHDLIANPNTVSLHVRTYNAKLHEAKLHSFIGLAFYQRAIELFPEESTFVVFSDRINWCKIYFSEMFGNNDKRKFVFIDERDGIKSLFLMAKMKHNVVPNSTLSWWAAYLNENPDKIVVVPEFWLPLNYPNDFYLPEWELVSPDYDAPYPEDMNWYDETTSFDGNG